MRKNDLIKKLEEIEGNPEIVLYNGFVDDWMHIRIEEGKLYKFKPSSKGFNWEVSPILDDIITIDRYKQKKVIYIEGKKRGIATWDRLGKIKY